MTPPSVHHPLGGARVGRLCPAEHCRRAGGLTAELGVQREPLPGPVAGCTQPLDLTSNGATIPAQGSQPHGSAHKKMLMRGKKVMFSCNQSILFGLMRYGAVTQQRSSF